MAGCSITINVVIVTVLLIAEVALGVEALRDVRVVLPSVVKAGGAATLLCLFDLESAPLYAVKWYRGTREFYRYVPGNRPPAQIIPFPGIDVDISASNDRQVTLYSVPPYLSGIFSCEVSADAPSFSTAVAYGELIVTDFPDIKINSEMYDGDQMLTVNCTYEPLKLPTLLTFYVNNEPAPRSLVREWAGGASLQFVPSPRDVSPHGELRLRCVLLVNGRFPLSSDSVAMWLPVRPTPAPVTLPAPTPPPPPGPPLAPPPPPYSPWGSPGAHADHTAPPDEPNKADGLNNGLSSAENIALILSWQLAFLLYQGNT